MVHLAGSGRGGVQSRGRKRGCRSWRALNPWCPLGGRRDGSISVEVTQRERSREGHSLICSVNLCSACPVADDLVGPDVGRSLDPNSVRVRGNLN